MNPARSTIAFLFDVDNTLLDNDRVIAHVKQWGPVALLTDGDVVFQPRKVDRSGLFDAVAGQVLISLHKEQELDDVAQRCPAEHYVMVEDKLRLLAAIKSIWGQRVTSVFVRQGHYAMEPNILAAYPAADVTLERIGDLLQYDLAQLVGPSKCRSISNYSNHLAGTPLDAAFAGQKWTRPN